MGPINAKDDADVSVVANYYGVSREVILRKLLDRKIVDSQFYEATVKRWRAAVKPRTPGGNYYLTKGAYLGDKYLQQAFKKYYQRHITLGELADYLDMKVKNAPRMEELILERGTLGSTPSRSEARSNIVRIAIAARTGRSLLSAV